MEKIISRVFELLYCVDELQMINVGEESNFFSSQSVVENRRF